MVRRAGILAAGAIVWGFTTLGSEEHGGSVAVAAAMPRIIVPTPAAPPEETFAADVYAAPRVIDYSQEAPRPQEAPAARSQTQQASAPAPERRGNRRGRRNVWVGPIPSPADWAPPEGPVRIALQAGHWKANEAPPELNGLKDNGTSAMGKAEWEVNLEIAELAATQLRALGYEVDVLPAVVPPSYRAHLFISIHADGSGDPRASGFRVASPRNDRTGRAAAVVELLEESYGSATGIKRLPTVTRRMQNYYAFNFQRYVHSLHPMTIAVILETGFLTSAADRRIIVDDQARAARGIVAAVMAFELTPPPGPAMPVVPEAIPVVPVVAGGAD